MNNINKVPKLRFSGFTDAWEQHKLNEFTKYESSSYSVNQFSHSEDIGEFPVFDANEEIIKIDKYDQENNYISIIKDGAGIGRTRVLPGKSSIIGTMGYILPNETDINFLINLVSNINWSKYQTGTTIPHIYYSQYGNERLHIPNIKEQEKIGTFFLNLDNLIATHLRKLEKTKSLKKSLLTKMFPKNGEDKPELRFSGFTDAWEHRRLGDYAIIKGRLGWKNLRQEEYMDTGPYMIAGRHIENGIINWESADRIPYWRYEESPEIMLENGDIIFSKDGTLGNPAIINDLPNEATINATMMLVRTGNKVDSNYFYQILNGDIFKRLIYIKVSGSSIPHLFQADMNEFVFPFTKLEEQIRIGTFFRELDNLIAYNQRKLDKLNELKKAFLNEMFV